MIQGLKIRSIWNTNQIFSKSDKLSILRGCFAVGILECTDLQTLFGIQGKVAALHIPDHDLRTTREDSRSLSRLHEPYSWHYYWRAQGTKTRISRSLQLRNMIPYNFQWFDVMLHNLVITIWEYGKHTRLVEHWSLNSQTIPGRGQLLRTKSNLLK